MVAQAFAAEPGPAPPALPVPALWREAPRIPLWPGIPPEGVDLAPSAVPAEWPDSYRRGIRAPELHVFEPAHPNGVAVLVIPGGAYWFVSIVNEGAEVAQRLTSLGYGVYVLSYRLPGEGWARRADVPLQDAQRAMRVIREREAAVGRPSAQVVALGFSAGGHLAATLATAHAEPAYAPVDALDRMDARPAAVGLVYPVVTMDARWTHALSRQLLLGDGASAADEARRSPERQVLAATPPLFLVHALDDEAVPVENSLLLFETLRRERRPVEAHFLQEGGHAFGVGRDGTPSAQWIALWSAWVQRTLGLRPSP